MSTGLDSTEHEEADARINPARGWYQCAMSIGVLAPVDVLRGLKRTKLHDKGANHDKRFKTR